VLESESTSEACLVTATATDGVFALDIHRFETCGVRACEAEADWLCVSVRFPIVNGLKLPEDDVIEITCKPPDPWVEGTNTDIFQKNT
jgi:hypothetical protein